VVHGLGRPVVDESMREVLSRLYDAQVTTVDAEIGHLLDGLSGLGLLDDTIVVITSDHGENIGEHGLYDHRMSLNRTVLHIPLIVRMPGVFDGGREVSSLVRLEDVTATLYELTHVSPPDDIEGVPLTRDLDGRIARAIHGNLLRAEDSLRRDFPSIDTRRLGISLRSTFDGHHHLIRYSDGRDELFDVRADPGELRDLSTTEPKILERMRRLDDDR
jgi:arylsulfatase A-like enzyme